MEDTSENRLGKKSSKHVSIGILAHVDAGKTTLSEGLMYTAGQLKKMGRVDNGDAFLDTDELERARGITIFSKQAVFSFEDTTVTLLDTPGHVDFSAEMERTLPVLNYGILVISGADGVQGHTVTLWRLLEKYYIPIFLFVNKMDQPGTDKNKILKELNARLGGNIVDFSRPEGEEFYESVALCDEELLEQFLENGTVDSGEIISLIKKRVLFPCFFGSALKMEGVEEFFRGLSKYAKAPVYPEEFGAKVFKIARDNQGTRLTYVKVTGGCIKNRMELPVEKTGEREKITQIRLYSGDRFEAIPEAEAGMVCALTGLTGTYPGEGLGFEKRSEKPVLEPVLTYRIELPEGCEPAVILPKLRELEEEEPELHIVWNEELQEIQAKVMGEVQIEILKSRIEKRFGVCVEFGTGNIVYKESIKNSVEGIGHFEPLRHYAEVHLWMEPGEPGSGVQIAADCSEDILDKNWQRLIMTHLAEREHPGVLTGSALTDIKITLIAGRAHLKHTEGGDFRQATYRAVRQGLMQAESVLLEPYYEFRLEIPETMVGRALADIEKMSGTFELEQGADGTSVLTGRAPVATMQDYPTEVTAYTKGEGRIFCTFQGYYPCHNASAVIENIGYQPEQDGENPTGSVFCTHGSGFYVSWEEVPGYAHVECVKERREEQMEPEETRLSSPVEDFIDVEEIDRILEQASHANKKGVPISHKGISGKKLRSLTTASVGLSKPRKKVEKGEPYLLVDGYNIIFAWEELRELAKVDIDGARGRLMDILCNYQGFQKCHLILVFDAYRVQNHRTEILDYHNIHVVYTKEAETADQYIEKFAHENGKRYDITVATSDGLEQIIIRGAGCRLLSARELEERVKSAEEQMREFFNKD
ncbi:MAG: TetM/TetW/TetO/TetS family tetracycline resistance ribosomal protection protein [Lachnospiraceae bacterium]|nr:TetM/TetW/TetO/TetS family tetracycline resistance ribosomal protection protein [Lachnospiraceae bacterium]